MSADFEIKKGEEILPVKFEDIKIDDIVRKLNGVDGPTGWKKVIKIESSECIKVEDV